MKRLALVLAAALLGTGCIDNTCDRFVTFDWTGGFRDANGALVGCSSASGAVSVVDVWVNGQLAGSFFCLDGSGSVAMPAGTSTVDVEGVEDPNGSNTIIFRDTLAVNAGCGNQVALVEPAEGRVAIAYSLPGGLCVTPPSFIWVRVQDDVANQLAVDSAADPTLFPCGQAVSFRLAAGSYTLLDAEERIPVGGGAYSPVSTDCTDRPFTVAAAATTTVSPVLADSTVACP